jgi:hypothetical protein
LWMIRYLGLSGDAAARFNLYIGTLIYSIYTLNLSRI